MEYKYKVSVIMGVYNEADKVINALESIMNQSQKHLQIIICDDASTDGTYETIKSFVKADANTILLHNEKNCGLAYSLNRCIDLSQGEYLARMDADDTCHIDRIKKQVDFLDKHSEYDLAGSQYIMTDEDGKEFYSHKKIVPNDSILPFDVPFAHPTVVIRKNSMNKLGKYNESTRTKYCEDLELWYRFFALGMKGYNLPEYLYYKNQRAYHYSKGKLRNSFDLFFVHVSGLKLLKAKWYRYLLAFKPIISAIIPNKIKYIFYVLTDSWYNL